MSFQNLIPTVSYEKYSDSWPFIFRDYEDEGFLKLEFVPCIKFGSVEEAILSFGKRLLDNIDKIIEERDYNNPINLSVTASNLIAHRNRRGSGNRLVCTPRFYGDLFEEYSKCNMTTPPRYQENIWKLHCNCGYKNMAISSYIGKKANDCGAVLNICDGGVSLAYNPHWERYFAIVIPHYNSIIKAWKKKMK